MRNKIIAGVLIVAIAITGTHIWQGEKAKNKQNEIREYTATFNSLGEARSRDNEIQARIAERIGARCLETWTNEQSFDKLVNEYIANNEYPDFIGGTEALLDADALIPLDTYLDKYPEGFQNIRNYLSHIDTELLKQKNGHIYWIPQFGIVRGEENEVIHTGEAFWIQTRVLKWADYPKVRTLEDYFQLLEDYMKANPQMADGTPNIAFTMLCEDNRYFGLENVPMFLDGYPNDGCCIVEESTKTVRDYNVSPTAKHYFAKLNEEFQKGIFDPESFTSTYSEYIDKLSTGAVLGMVDQWWNFAYDIVGKFEKKQLGEQGCEYVPLPITISEDITNRWHVKRSEEVDTSSGISITKSCEDVRGALQFIDDLLDPEIQDLRFWGEKDVDYTVNEKGVFEMSQEQVEKRQRGEALENHFCTYSYFPRFEGYGVDGINAYQPEDQPDIFFNCLSKELQECLRAYDCKTYVDMIGTSAQPGKWYPMYSYSSNLTYRTEAGAVWKDIERTKHTWLPKVIMSEAFDEAWDSYVAAYQECNPNIFFEDLQKELDRRLQKE